MIEEKHQDYIYLKENYYDNPKEIFIFLGKLIDKCSLKNNILDIGCARGEFLYYLNKIFTETKFTGIDYSKNLIDEAKKNLSLFNNINFENSSGENFKLNKKYDVITLLGVLSYFDDLYKILENIELHLNDCGKVFILGFFNKYDIDVRISYRDNKRFSNFESGWNYHSLENIKKVLSTLGMKINNIHNFELSFHMEQQKDDFCRAWHINTDLGKMYTNGLGLLYNLEVIEIIKDRGE